MNPGNIKRRERASYVTATQLADFVKCERLAVLDHYHGHAPSRKNQAARRAGDDAHARHHQEVTRYARRPTVTDPRCFLATSVFGPAAWETEQLRDWRDRQLAGTSVGRSVIRVYYRLSPVVATFIDKRPRLQVLLRSLLERMVSWIS